MGSGLVLVPAVRIQARRNLPIRRVVLMAILLLMALEGLCF
jgi:hypothetical protein